MTPPIDRAQGKDQILKVDTIGRVRTPPERREALLDRFENSGMSSKAFAEHHGIKYTTFANWIQQRRKRCKGKGSDVAGDNRTLALSLAQVVVDDGAEGAGGALSVALPGGARLEIRSLEAARLAAELLGALGVRA